MTAFRSARVTFAVSGSTTITLPFTPVGVQVFVSPKGSTDTVTHLSQGAADGTLQNCTFTGGTDGSKGFNDRIISMWESGTETLRVDFTSFGTNQITLNVVTPNSNYQAYMRYIG